MCTTMTRKREPLLPRFLLSDIHFILFFCFSIWTVPLPPNWARFHPRLAKRSTIKVYLMYFNCFGRWPVFCVCAFNVALWCSRFRLMFFFSYAESIGSAMKSANIEHVHLPSLRKYRRTVFVLRRKILGKCIFHVAKRFSQNLNFEWNVFSRIKVRLIFFVFNTKINSIS